MSNQIELRQLQSFLVLAKELHFRNAAEKLFISQPGLSKQIQQQIEYLNGFLSHTFTHLKNLDNGLEGELKIGFVGSAMQRVIPELIKKCNTKLTSDLFG